MEWEIVEEFASCELDVPDQHCEDEEAADSGLGLFLATVGYGIEGKRVRGAMELLLDALVSEGVVAVIDTRLRTNFGFWRSQDLERKLESVDIAYLNLGRLYGVPKAMRDTSDFDAFTDRYLSLLEKRFASQPEVERCAFRALEIEALDALHRKSYKPRSSDEGQNAPCVALLCCEPYVASHDNCHRFVLAKEMVRRGFVEPCQVKHIDLERYNTRERTPRVIGGDEEGEHRDLLPFSTGP